MLGTIFWICGVALVVGGAVALGRGRTVDGGIAIAVGLLLGPVAMMLVQLTP